MERTSVRSILIALVFTSFSAQAYAEVIGVTPQAAYDLTESGAYIVDVRTAAEWWWVGHPGANLSHDRHSAFLDEQVVNVSYMIIKKTGDTLELKINPRFVSDMEQMFPYKTNVTLITMCLSGGRGKLAAEALKSAGYNVYNMETGFEGEPDKNGYRTKNGWKDDGLPYKASKDGAYVY